MTFTVIQGRSVISAVGLIAMLAALVNAQVRRPTADVTPTVESERVHAGTVVRAALQVSLPEGLHVQSNAPRDPSLIPTAVTAEPPAGVTVSEIVFPASTDLKQIGQDVPLAVFERDFVIGVRLAIGAAVPAGELIIPAHLRYQACDATICYPPSTAHVNWTMNVVPAATAVVTGHGELFGRIPFSSGDVAIAKPGGAKPLRSSPAAADDGVAQLERFTVLGTSGGYLDGDEFLRFVRNAETGTREPGLFEGRGPLAILLIVLLGGLALNLTPCVLPMIPINLAIIGAGTHAGSRARGFSLGAAYGGAMAIVYGILGLIVILTASTFGTINSSLWFNVAIAALFVVLALAMFDILTIDFSRWLNRFGTGSHRGSFVLAFGMGAVAALLAGACVAPVVIQVVLFSSNLYATGTRIALALPFVLGVGMAVPWPVAGAGIAALPKPGRWMVRVKQAFGVLILGTAAYYGYIAYGLLANRWVDPAAVTSSVQEQLEAGWYASLAEGLSAAERDQQPALIDLWATWCKNCLTMDKTTLANPAVTRALEGYVKIKFQAEEPDRDPAKTVMQRFGAVGLPTYVIVRPNRGASTRADSRPGL